MNVKYVSLKPDEIEPKDRLYHDSAESITISDCIPETTLFTNNVGYIQQ